MTLAQAVARFNQIYRLSGVKDARKELLEMGVDKELVNELELLALVAEAEGIERDRLRKAVEEMNLGRTQ
jgi:SOS response regulatory protein OraA/RecX